MEADMDFSAHRALRDANGRFIPGQSGNPAGKKPGTRNRATVLREALRDGEDVAAARVVIDKALAGDAVAARFCVGRLEPRPRGRTITLDLPEGAGARDIVAAFDATLRAMAAGEITPDEAVMVARVLDGRRKALAAARERKHARAEIEIKTEPSPACGRGQGEGMEGLADQDLDRLSAQPSPHPSPVNGRGSFPSEGRGAIPGGSPAFRLHFACGGTPNAPYLAQPSSRGSP
jgi:hypothetical protein